MGELRPLAGILYVGNLGGGGVLYVEVLVGLL